MYFSLGSCNQMGPLIDQKLEDIDRYEEAINLLTNYITSKVHYFSHLWCGCVHTYYQEALGAVGAEREGDGSPLSLCQTNE